MIPKIIHYCWFGRNPLPPLALECIASWKKFFPDYEIWQWGEDDNVNVNDNENGNEKINVNENVNDGKLFDKKMAFETSWQRPPGSALLPLLKRINTLPPDHPIHQRAHLYKILQSLIRYRPYSSSNHGSFVSHCRFLLSYLTLLLLKTHRFFSQLLFFP